MNKIEIVPSVGFSFNILETKLCSVDIMDEAATCLQYSVFRLDMALFLYFYTG
jgi:hypothetical protein